MKRFFLIAFVVALSSFYVTVHAQSDSCLSPRFFAGQEVRVIGSIDAGGMPFRDDPSFSQPVKGFVPLDTIVTSYNMELCVEGRNWYSIVYSQTGGEQPTRVWIMDGDGQSYWLEPIPICSGGLDRTRIFPADSTYGQGLIVDGYEESTNTLRFSAERLIPNTETFERHYFNFDSRTGMMSETAYWYRDLITHTLTDKLGITEQVFGNGEDFTTLYVSPDRAKILYRVRNPQIPDCAHGCSTETLWLANSDGSNPVSLSELYGTITRVIWGQNGKIYLSVSPLEVYEADFTLTLCTDGSCAIYENASLLTHHSLPFDYVRHMPTTSPNGKWIALTVGGESLVLKGMSTTAIILASKGDQFIELPYNGGAAASILWLDDDTILYPVIGLGWKGEDYGLPSYFYQQDALWEIHLNFDKLTYRVGDRVTQSTGNPDYERMFNPEQTQHIILGYIPIIYSTQSITFYCFSKG